MDNARWGTLYDLNTKRLAFVQFYENNDRYTLTIPEQILKTLPDQVFLIPDDLSSRFHPFLIQLSKDFECCEEAGSPDGTEEGADGEGKRPRNTIMLVNATRVSALTAAESRSDYRLPVCFKMNIQSPALDETTPVTVQNLSAGGLFFISDEEFDKGMQFSCSLPIPESPQHLVAQVINKVPTSARKLTGYCCQFLPIPSRTEETIRKYIFQQQREERLKQLRRQEFMDEMNEKS